MPESLADLEQQQNIILRQISELEDFRARSITGTGGRCNPIPVAIVIAPDDLAHGPHPRLTYKVNGKDITENFATHC